MKTFLAIYLGSESGIAEWKKMDEDKRKSQEKAGMEAWSKWATANQKSIVDQGTPLGKTKRFENHPHFTIFPGDAVEVMECLPMPQM